MSDANMEAGTAERRRNGVAAKRVVQFTGQTQPNKTPMATALGTVGRLTYLPYAHLVLH